MAVQTYPKALAHYTRRDNRKVMYVAQVPGDGGVDWGWTDNPKAEFDPALALSPYWQRRFMRDMERVGNRGVLTPID